MRFWIVTSTICIANAINPNQKFDSPYLVLGALLWIGVLGLVLDMMELYHTTKK